MDTIVFASARATPGEKDRILSVSRYQSFASDLSFSSAVHNTAVLLRTLF